MGKGTSRKYWKIFCLPLVICVDLVVSLWDPSMRQELMIWPDARHATQGSTKFEQEKGGLQIRRATQPDVNSWEAVVFTWGGQAGRLFWEYCNGSDDHTSHRHPLMTV
jgi:hypothetical protein